jgi:hypothetical protein
VLVLATVPSKALWAMNTAARSNPERHHEMRWLLSRVRQSRGNIARVAQVVESTKWEKAWSRTNAVTHLKK